MSWFHKLFGKPKSEPKYDPLLDKYCFCPYCQSFWSKAEWLTTKKIKMTYRCGSTAVWKSGKQLKNNPKCQD